MNAFVAILVLSSLTLISARYHGHHDKKKAFDNLLEPDELFAIGLKQAFKTVHAVQKISDEKDGFGLKMASRALDTEKRGMKRNMIRDHIHRINKINGDGPKRWHGDKKWAKDGRKVSKQVNVESDRGTEKKLNMQKKGNVEGVKSVKISGSKVASGTFSATWKSQVVKSINWGNQNLTETDRINKEGKIVGVIGSDGRKAINVVSAIKMKGNKSIKGSKGEAKSVDVNKTVKAEPVQN